MGRTERVAARRAKARWWDVIAEYPKVVNARALA
jgi:hypothetical protein